MLPPGTSPQFQVTGWEKEAWFSVDVHPCMARCIILTGWGCMHRGCGLPLSYHALAPLHPHPGTSCPAPWHCLPTQLPSGTACPLPPGHALHPGTPPAHTRCRAPAIASPLSLPLAPGIQRAPWDSQHSIPCSGHTLLAHSSRFSLAPLQYPAPFNLSPASCTLRLRQGQAADIAQHTCHESHLRPP